jgi:zinc/manganese transport system permease protein
MADPNGLGPSWDAAADLRQLFAYPFMVNAYRAGTIVATAAAVVGWFMVTRRQSFVGHTLALVGFPGAAGATLLGLAPTVGYLGFCLGAAAVIAVLPGGGRGALAGAGGYSQESAGIGTVQASALACGFLFVSLYRGFLNGVNALLFGTFLGITNQQVLTLLVVAVAALLVLAVIGRPLLFASVDPDVAAATGVPVRGLGVAFLAVLAATAAETSQITGSLLVFALLVMPAATAQRVTARPVRSLAFSVTLALLVTWAALAAAYWSPYPIGFWLTTLAFAAYLAAVAGGALAAGSRRWLPRSWLRVATGS